jgi:heme exporter protein C
MISLANPTRFLALATAVLPWLAVATVVALAAGLYLGFFVAPPDYQQGETVRIMFVHVPAASLALFGWTMMSVASLGVLVWKHPLADVAAKAAAPIGAAFAFVTLFTGALWGKPMWGTWWVWDARLTSMLVLFFMYLGVMALRSAIDEPASAARLVAILTLVGFVNVPIVKFSVDWWNTLHQGASILRVDGPAIHPTIFWPLMANMLAFALFFVLVHLVLMRAELRRRRIRSLRLIAAGG